LDQNITGPASLWWCEDIVPKFSPKKFFVIGLESGLPCPNNQKMCSNLIGWYGVRKLDGEVVAWDVADDVSGKVISAQSSN
jgi:hypothetical protein